MPPIAIGASPPTKPAHGVIATRPATAPDAAPSVVAWPDFSRSTISQRDHRRRRRDERVEEGLRGHEVGGERRTRVEAEPTEPQDAGTQQRERQGVRWHRVLRPAASLPEQDHQRERTGSRVDVDDRATGEVERAAVREPAATEDPVRNRQVHEDRPQREEADPRRPAHAIRDRSGDERGRDHRERELERDEREVGNPERAKLPSPFVMPVEARVVEVADEPLVAEVAEGEREAEQHPDDGDDAHGEEVLHEHRQHVLGPHHAAVEEREAQAS